MAGAPQITGFEQIVRRITEAGQNVRLGPGVVSKTTAVALALLVLWGFIVGRFTNNWVFDALLFGCGVIATFFVVLWVGATHKFARDNPAQAMLEGAHVVDYERVKAEAAEAKGQVNHGGPLVSEDSVPRLESGLR